MVRNVKVADKPEEEYLALVFFEIVVFIIY